ncbi:MAG: apolipoprotein N-acyltransferase [Actinomycetaceae bacterium]|nr:apolipoprotein N-acyltransferase [Actinomycetaceae bacterium]
MAVDNRYWLELPPRRRFLDYSTVGVAAVAMWAAFPYIEAYVLAYPALALLVSVVDRSRVWRGTWYAFVFGLIFFLLHIWWATISVGSYLPWFALAFIQALFLGLWGWIVGVIRSIEIIHRSPFAYAMAIALAWVGIEQLRGTIPFGGFPWGYIAYSQVDAPVGKLAPWGSEIVIGFAVVAAAVLFRRTFSLVPAHATGNWWSRPLALVLGITALVAPAAIDLPAASQEGTVRVGIIQGNIEQPVNDTYRTPLKVTRNHANTTLRALEEGMKADLIIWGENSLDQDPRSSREARTILSDAVNRAGVPFIVGVIRYDDRYRYNDMITWYPDGQTRQSYTKQKPVPFGEYIPFRQYLSILSKETAKVSVDMLPGTGPGIIDVTLDNDRTLRTAVGICFEAAYEEVFATGVRLGGQIIVVPTNNSSFGYAPEAAQQLQMVRLRAMSLSRSAMQVSTNGVSAIIRPNGTMRSTTGLFESAWRVEDVPIRTQITFSARFGDAMTIGTYLLLGALVFVSAVSTIRKRSL